MNLNDSNHVIEPTSLCFKVYNKMEKNKNIIINVNHFLFGKWHYKPRRWDITVRN